MNSLTPDIIENPFVLRSYGRTELAQLYHPNLKTESAWRALRHELELCKPLARELRAQGYISSQRHFTPRQVRTITQYLGTP
ncbi:MAG: DUF4248 domain-containing protein [Bacteroidaceae bacterium]|nr:DUF4248 domain-containing protein [Bacteroidaceae bacterium]